jgi:hypothetical protein
MDALHEAKPKTWQRINCNLQNIYRSAILSIKTEKYAFSLKQYVHNKLT